MVRAGRVEAPLEDIALDHYCPGDFAEFSALSRGADIDQETARREYPPRLCWAHAFVTRPRSLQQLVDTAVRRAPGRGPFSQGELHPILSRPG